MKGAAQNQRAQRQASGRGLGRAMWAAVGVACVWAVVGLVRTEASGGGGGSAEPAEPFRLSLEESTPHEMRLQRPGKAEHTYFLQSSENLVDWVYEPAIFAGEHYGPEYDRHEVQITPQSARGFFRAIRSEHYAGDPWWADFDGDGIPNGIELLIGYDPLKADSLGDGILDGQRDSHAIGIPDWWQLLHFGETGIDPNPLSANGVHTVIQVYHQGGDPHDSELSNQAVPWDPHATWDRAPESRYVVIGLGTPPNYQGGVDGIVDPYATLPQGVAELVPAHGVYHFSPPQFGVVALGPDGRVMVTEDRRALLTGVEQAPDGFRTWVGDPSAQDVWGTPLQWEANAAVMGIGLGADGAALGVGVLPLVDANDHPTSGPAYANAYWHKQPPPSEGQQGSATRVYDNLAASGPGFVIGEFKAGHDGTQFHGLYAAGMDDFGIHRAITHNPFNYIHESGISEIVDLPSYSVAAYRPAFARSGEVFLSAVFDQGEGQLENYSKILLPANDTPDEPEQMAALDGPGQIDAQAMALLQGAPDQYGILTSSALWLRQPDGSWAALRENSTAVSGHNTGESAAQGGVGGLAINSRGEILRDTTTLWRNGKDYDIDELVLSPGWSDFHITQLNDAGMMAGFAVPDPGEGQGPGLAQVVIALPVHIEPDADMPGVIGDVVESAKPGSTIKHFVRPKKSIELNQDYVILMVAGGLTAEQIMPGHAKQIVEWDGGEEVPNEPLKRRVKRDATGMTEVKIKVKQTGAVAAQMNVWVVWCDSKPVGQIPISVNVVNQPPIGAVTTVSGGLQFTHTIEPPEIITGEETPNLSGPKTVDPPGGNHPLTGDDLKGGANNKWDASRQFRYKHSNPNNLPDHAFSQPAPLITVLAFPENPVEGNDDSSPDFEAPMIEGHPVGEPNNPYQEISEGTLWSTDRPNFSISKGNLDDTFEFNLQLREFARLELAGMWYRISDFKPWRFRVLMRKVHNPELGIEFWAPDPHVENPAVIQSNHNDF